MTTLLDRRPFGPRNDEAFLNEMNALTRRHLRGCKEYARIWPGFKQANKIEDLPFLHVGLFKRIPLKTVDPSLKHTRALRSSSTSGRAASQVFLDDKSGALQSQSLKAIHESVLGEEKRPLVIFDSPRSLQARGEVMARVAAALSLQPLASSTRFVMPEFGQVQTLDWDQTLGAFQENPNVIFYGFTWVLWQAFQSGTLPAPLLEVMKKGQISFVHSGGWKKLEAQKVNRKKFNEFLLDLSGPGSVVVDYYGLVEQAGILYPECSEGFRHAPKWADVLVRDSETFESKPTGTGALQLMNLLALGAPYHNVLTEDIGRLIPGDCPCGKKGRRFILEGRLPQAEIRGCANVS